jgi:Anti-sigma-K factor rskA
VQHCTPETLALAALREPLPDHDAAHLDGCTDCRTEVTTLRRSVDALVTPEFAASVAPVAPPPAVWGAIAAATGVTAVPRPERVAASASPAPAVTAVPDAPVEEPSGPGVVRELRPRRSRVLLAVAASLVAGIAVGAGTVAVLTRDDEGTAVVATDLEPLDQSDAAGLAEIVASGEGEQLRVELTAPELDDGYYEVWLLEPGAQDMYSIGVVRSGATTLDLPPGIDLDDFPVVDVSVEQLDGDPTHSGVSVARGVLES